MKRMFNMHRIYAMISPRFRDERMKRFIAVMNPTKKMRILDVGGYSGYWREIGIESHVTLANLHELEADQFSDSEQFDFVNADGCALPFNDGEFDLVYSNSVIEHLYTWEKQEQFAKEIKRVGKRYWLQTPAKEFPIEPHVLTPFIHWLPKSWRLRLAKWFTLRAWILDESRPTRQSIWDLMDEVRLLNMGEIQTLFPTSKLHTERFLGIKKSYIVYSEDQREG